MSRRALLVGINRFREKLASGEVVDRKEWRLKGCVDDARHIAQLLRKHYRFEEESEIRLLLDSQATREGILEGLRWLLSDYEGSGTDVRLFHISSHGTFVEDQSGDETTDGRDEVIVPHVHDWNDPFRDDELGALFADIPEDVNFTFIADCCHSGTVSGVGKERFRERFLYPPDEIRKAVEARSPDLSKDPSASRPKNRYGLRIVDRHALLAASRADELAAERAVAGPRGVFSWALERAVEEHLDSKRRRSLTYEGLMELAGDLLEFELQEPQLECPEAWRKRSFLKPLGSGESGPATQSSRLSRFAEFLEHLGSSDKLMGRKSMLESIEAAGLTEADVELIRGRNAAKIEAHLSEESRDLSPQLQSPDG